MPQQPQEESPNKSKKYSIPALPPAIEKYFHGRPKLPFIAIATVLVVLLIGSIFFYFTGFFGNSVPGKAVYSFGINANGQLGIKIDTGRNNPTPKAVSGIKGGILQVSAGNGHSLVLTDEGKIYAVGDNSYGQLGSKENKGSNNPTPKPINGITGTVTQIAAGFLYSMVVVR